MGGGEAEKQRRPRRCPRGIASESRETDRDALERAFADVKPLEQRDPKASDASARERGRPPGPDRPAKPAEQLIVEQESNGIVSGRRGSTHGSILDALEDPTTRGGSRVRSARPHRSRSRARDASLRPRLSAGRQALGPDHRRQGPAQPGGKGTLKGQHGRSAQQARPHPGSSWPSARPHATSAAPAPS